MGEDIRGNVEEELREELEEELEEKLEIMNDPFFLRAKFESQQINMEELPNKNHHSTTIMILLCNSYLI